MVAFARTLGLDDAAKIFQSILGEEEATDKKLTALARVINEQAASEQEDGEDDD